MTQQIYNMTAKNAVTNDVIEYIDNSVIQHGKYNNRIYLMKLSIEDFPDIIDKLDTMAIENRYSKIFAKIPSFAKDKFVENGYTIEAFIPRFHNEKEEIYFIGKYFDESRRIDNKIEDIKKILDIANSKTGILEKTTAECILPKGFKYEICNESHIYKITDLYKQIFDTYPFPIYDPEYIRKTMNENIIYFNITKDDKIVAMSSTEMDMNLQIVEMTDFATLSEYQGNGFALYLLYKMEDEMRRRNMKILYTISRAASYGINIIFAKMGYKYGGTLTNNTNISVTKMISNLESMNVWYRQV